MNILHLITMTVDFHDAAIPTFVSRCTEIDGAPYVLAKDIGLYYDLKADEDGDYRSFLARAGIPYIDREVSHKGETIGSHALLTEAASKLMRAVPNNG
jgi:hypothetical protein